MEIYNRYNGVRYCVVLLVRLVMIHSSEVSAP